MSKLIKYAYLKEETDISDVVDNKKLDNPIKNAGDRLRALIGVSFYDELVSQIITTPTSLSTANLAFFDPYVKQYLAWQAYEFWIIKANTYETRTGVRTFKEDNSDPASDKLMGEQIAMAKRQTQFYKDTMINFLRTAQRVTSTAYPLYTTTCGASTGSGFGISAISRIDTVNFSINRQISQDYLNDEL
tara:strand:- start:2598 stop:3164 length:567 start_codon:yes stop_codon:yes gene_type:complete